MGVLKWKDPWQRDYTEINVLYDTGLCNRIFHWEIANHINSKFHNDEFTISVEESQWPELDELITLPNTSVISKEDELKYFNSRSRHNVPMTYSKKVFSEWENDQIAQYYEPFFGNEKGSLSGDCLPFPKVTKDQLDKELDDYFETKNKCAIETDDESEEMVNSDELDKLSQSLGCVEIMDNDDFKEVNERLVKITTRTHRNQKNKLVYQIEMGDGFDKIIRNSKHSHYSESY